ncbi:hypothetical protein H0H93_008081 [Arthromyces matolae]|nr:hypothetical protein H0H93_008081 [Arthromyces matolae]
MEGHTDGVTSVAFSSDGSCIVSGSYDRSVRVWDTSTGQELEVLEGHTDGVTSVALSSDGSRIVSGSVDKSVRVWDASTGQELKVLEGHMHFVNSVAFTRDGNHIVSGSVDKSVRVWDTLTGQELKALKNAVTSIPFSDDKRPSCSGSWDQTPYIWDNAVQKYTRRKADNFDGHWLLSAHPTHPYYLMYVPADARLPDSSNILTIPTSAASSVDFTHAALGSEWHKCYSP